MKKLSLFLFVMSLLFIVQQRPVLAVGNNYDYVVVTTPPATIGKYQQTTVSFRVNVNNAVPSVIQSCYVVSSHLPLNEQSYSSLAVKSASAVLRSNTFGGIDINYTPSAIVESGAILGKEINFIEPVSIYVESGDYVTFTVKLLPENNVPVGATVSYAFQCFGIWTSGEELLYDQTSSGLYEATVVNDMPASLKSVYFTFWKFKYGAYVSPAQMKVGDNISLKNFDPKKVRVLSISLYDYVINKNQCNARTWKNSTTLYMKACTNLPTGRKYTYIMKFQDIATGYVRTMYFVFNTVRPGYVVK
jgi:hypothetical protein